MSRKKASSSGKLSDSILNRGYLIAGIMAAVIAIPGAILAWKTLGRVESVPQPPPPENRVHLYRGVDLDGGVITQSTKGDSSMVFIGNTLPDDGRTGVEQPASAAVNVGGGKIQQTTEGDGSPAIVGSVGGGGGPSRTGQPANGTVNLQGGTISQTTSGSNSPAIIGNTGSLNLNAVNPVPTVNPSP